MKNFYDYTANRLIFQAINTHAPPTAVILLSAVFEKYLALTTTG